MTLEQYLKRKGIGAAEFARTIDVDPGTVSRVLRGLQWPRKGLARHISKATDGRVKWDEMLKLGPADEAD